MKTFPLHQVAEAWTNPISRTLFLMKERARQVRS